VAVSQPVVARAVGALRVVLPAVRPDIRRSIRRIGPAGRGTI
jgi:hypothetical protein